MPARDVFSDPDAKNWRWLYVMPWYASADWTHQPAEGHADLWADAVDSLDSDDRWLAWWTNHAPRPNCSLYPYFQDDEDKAAGGEADLRRHQLIARHEGLEQTPDDVRVFMRYDADWETPIDTALVHRQVLDGLAMARAGLNMPQPPPAPWETAQRARCP
jgi:hypothetical protein